MIRGHFAAALAVAALVFSTTSHPAAAETVPWVWAKSGVNGTSAIADFDACTLKSKDIHPGLDPDQVATYQAATGGGVIPGLVLAMAISAANTQAQHHYVARCMRLLGYGRLSLDRPEVILSDTARTSAQRAALLETLYASSSFPARLAQATRPIVHLPPAADEPLIYQAYRFDPAAMSASPGVVTKGVALSGPAGHRATASLAKGVEESTHNLRLKAGTVLQELVVPGPDGALRNYWCWISPFGLGNVSHCFRDEAGDYYVTDGPLISGRSILLMPPPGGGEGEGFSDVDVVIEKSAQDLIGPADMVFSVRKIGDDGVTLVATAAAGKQKFTIWARTLSFNANGDAILPFWTHRLVLHKSGDGVTVVFSADGDGTPLPSNDFPLFRRYNGMTSVG
jgi:hypothetical protein